jgi:hypothetical protein
MSLGIAREDREENVTNAMRVNAAVEGERKTKKNSPDHNAG